ncbi:GT-D fold domain-containing glycosyltransferase [Paenibacillus chartarius]|uniref:GT-D fold domain-containing glycosyltransferase n=1 Tax=Paenibacillus chartarius TaxID=747481 RepID=A0ABV6DH60_9BACL
MRETMAAYLPLPTVLKKIQNAVARKKPFSLVRVGDGENIVLAQNTVWTIKRVLREPWAKRGNKGVTLPNVKLRDDIVRSIRKASVVGILPRNDRMIRAPRYLKRTLTDQVFRYHGLKPSLTCNACVNRMMPHHPLFRNLVKGKRILIINRDPKAIKAALEKSPYKAKVTAMITFTHYRQIPATLRKAAKLKHAFDIALISCGVNAVIMAPRVAELTGKVAIDFGKAPKMMKRK